MRSNPLRRLPNSPPPSRRGRGSNVSLATFAALIAGTLALPAAAQPAPNWKQMTSKQLATACHASEPAQHATCIGYVAGIYDLQFAPTPPRGVCPPTDLTPELLAEVVMAYTDTHEDGPAPAAVGQAIVRFFPCSEARK